MDVAIGKLKRGQGCLWVGAGVGIQLARAGSTPLPDWPTLVSALEAQASIAPPDRVPYAARLDVVLDKLGRERFQRALRLALLEPLASSTIDAWRNSRATPPQELKALAHLGFVANPIVNFNIETITSEALVCGSGPWWPVVFSPPVPDSLSKPRSSRGANGSSHQRRVYHPHGALELSGVCVMTEREYRSMNGTLALQLAAHAAFGLDLVIVGMSLEDEYLRDQLDRFRSQIRSVTWVVGDEPREELKTWAYRSRVMIEQVRWADFWDAIISELPGPESEKPSFEWLGLVQHCVECQRQPLTEATNNILGERGGDPAKMASWFWKAAMHGEDPIYAPKKLADRVHRKEEDDLAMDTLKVASTLKS